MRSKTSACDGSACCSGRQRNKTRSRRLASQLEALGWSEGRNIRIDYRFAGGDADRIRAYVTELVNAAPDLILANTSPVITALKRATSTIPIVFAVVNDPVGQGFVAEFGAPRRQYHGFRALRIRDGRKVLGLAPGDGSASQSSDAPL